MAYTVTLKGGSPWGFRFQGGSDFNEPIKVAKVRFQWVMSDDIAVFIENQAVFTP